MLMTSLPALLSGLAHLTRGLTTPSPSAPEFGNDLKSLARWRQILGRKAENGFVI
jgi:hypothetical protein